MNVEFTFRDIEEEYMSHIKFFWHTNGFSSKNAECVCTQFVWFELSSSLWFLLLYSGKYNSARHQAAVRMYVNFIHYL